MNTIPTLDPSKRTALLSVSDKTGIVELAQMLVSQGFQLVSTGGTHRLLDESGIAPLFTVESVTDFPEGMGGRIKTLHPKMFGGLLANHENAEHVAFLAENNLPKIDLVVVNLYPFRATYETAGATSAEIIEKIDIGGPSMIRAAAKNWQSCGVLVDPADYATVTAEYHESGDISPAIRKKLAAKVFAMTAHYDLLVAKFWSEEAELLPLRYGENPHQKGVILPDPFEAGPSLPEATLLQGKPLSFNNYNDATGALELGLSMGTDVPFVAIIKHGTPCGAAMGATIEEAFDKALAGDPVSAFGGIIAINQTVTKAVAEKIVGFFNEVVMAPAYTDEALAVLATKKNVRVMIVTPWAQTPAYHIKSVRGGTLVQDLDTKIVTAEMCTTATTTEPTDAQMDDMLLGWKLVKIVKSNAIVIVKDGMMIGKGGGQTSRVDAMRQAIAQAGERITGAVVASDAFFPFADNIALADEAGITAIIQPGGSRNDDKVIAAANEAGIAMVMTGIRGFLH